jgi:hypothetical protein
MPIPYPLDPAKSPQIEYERGLLFHVNNVLHTRVNLLLVVESIFFAALAQVRNSTGSGARRFALVLCVLGLAFTVLVWITLRSLKARSDFLTKHLAITDTLYEAYLSKSGLYSTTILTDVLPGAAGLAWIALIAEMLYFQ